MKKIFSFVLAIFAAFSVSAATLNLDLAEAGSTGWGGVTYDAITHVMTFPVGWEGGSGWWIDADWSAYTRVVVELDKAPCKIQLAVEYGAGETSNGYETAMCSTNETQIEIALNAAKKNAVQKVYLQAETSCSITLKAAYATSDEAVDPLDGLTGTDVGTMTEPGKTCYLPLVDIKDYDYFEIIITNKTDEAQNGWGIGKIVAVSDWNNPSLELLCNNPGAGKDNRFVIAQADMLEYAKRNGSFHTDEYGQQGVHINVYDDKATLKSVKGYRGGSNPGTQTQKTDLGTPDQYGVVYIDLATLQQYTEFEVVINVTNAQVGLNWGIGKIVPVNNWTADYVELKSVREGVAENVITLTQEQMLNAAKVNGTYYTDEYDRQGVMVQAYDDKATLVVVRGIGAATAVEETVVNVIENLGDNIYRSQMPIQLISISGATLATSNMVDLNQFPQGVYILRAGKQVMKVQR